MNKNEEFRRIEPERQSDPERLKLIALFNPLVKKHGRNPIMNYIEKDTGGTTSIVVDRWLSGEHIPVLAIRRGIISALEHFPPDSLPAMENIPLSTPKSKTIENSSKKPKLKRITKKEQIIRDNEEKIRILMEKLKKEGKIL
ncbi:MAG: hypothetical protein AAB902_00605 [Patescibacteria group bacterium]